MYLSSLHTIFSAHMNITFLNLFSFSFKSLAQPFFFRKKKFLCKKAFLPPSSKPSLNLNHHLSAFEGSDPVHSSRKSEIFPSSSASIRTADGDEYGKKTELTEVSWSMEMQIVGEKCSLCMFYMYVLRCLAFG